MTLGSIGILRRWAYALMVALLILAAGAVDAAAQTPAEERYRVEVLREDDRGLHLRIHFPEPAQEVVEPPQGGTYLRVTLPEFFPESAARVGHPDLPHRGIPFGLPEGVEARIVSATVTASTTFNGPAPLPVPRRRFIPDDPVPVQEEVYREDAEAYDGSATYPPAWAELGPQRGWRHQAVQSLVVFPVRTVPQSGVYRVARTMEVELAFTSTRGLVGGARVPLIADAPGWDPLMDGSLINASSARAFRTRAAPLPAAALPQADHINVRVRVGGSGMARLTHAQLAAAGWPASVPVDEVRVVERDHNGTLPNPLIEREIPRRVLDHNVNNLFDAGDEVLFYAFNYKDRFQPVWADERYSYHHTYWFHHDGTPGRDFSEVDGFPAGTYTPVASFLHSDRYDDDRIYTNVPGESGSNFLPTKSSMYRLGLSDTNVDFTFTACDFDTAGNVTLRAHWQGWDDTNTTNEHYVSLDVNGTTVLDERVFFGKNPFTYNGDPMPSVGLLADGDNTLTVRGRNQSSANRVGAYFDWFEVSYDRLLVAKDDRLVFHTGGQTGDLEYLISGFSTGDLLAVDISDPANPFLLNGQVEDAGGTFNLRLRFSVGGTARRVAVLTTASASGLPASPHPLSPDLGTEIAPGLPRDLIAAGAGADYILLTHPTLEAEWAPLVAHRESQGHTVFLCDVIEIYDQFSGGNKTPWAIQRFLTQAYRTWTPAPSFLLFGGDGNEDYRKDMTGSTEDWVPTMMHRAAVPGTRGLELAGTDNWFVAFLRPGDSMFDTLPEMHAARIPASTPEEVQNSVAKILAYESMDPGDEWRKRIFILSDDQYSNGITADGAYCWKNNESNFRLASEAVRDSIQNLGGLACTEVIHFSMSAEMDTVAALFRNPGPGDCPRDPTTGANALGATRSYTRTTVAPRVRQILDQGHLVWEFTGHANNHAMASELLFQQRSVSGAGDMDRVSNTGRPFLFMGYACHLMEFESAVERSSGRGVGETLLMAPNRGAIGVMASTGYEWLHTNPFAQIRSSRALFWDLPRDPDTNRPRRLFAEAMTRAFTSLVHEDGRSDFVNMLRTYQTFGDPALRVDVHAAKFEVSVEGAVTEEGTPLTAPSFTDSLLVTALVSDDVDVSSIRVFEGAAELPPERIAVVPPGATESGLQVYQVSFKTVLRLGDYEVAIQAEDWTGRVSRFALPVSAEVSLTADGRLLESDVVNRINGGAVLRAEILLPVPVEAQHLELSVDGLQVATSITALDEDNRRWQLEAQQDWGPGEHVMELRALHPQGGELVRTATFEVSADPLTLVDVFFYPNPYESGPASLVYELNRSARDVRLSVYTVKGRRVLRRNLPIFPGRNAFRWDLRDDAGDPVANGVYLFVLQMDGEGGEDIRHIERVAVTR